jgi:hypothetical protein
MAEAAVPTARPRRASRTKERMLINRGREIRNVEDGQNTFCSLGGRGESWWRDTTLWGLLLEFRLQCERMKNPGLLPAQRPLSLDAETRAESRGDSPPRAASLGMTVPV